ncbi:hypothetical protein [Winogradskyella thalassocola]|uniref:YD repeat-containing protein n=1 Tax=Winogradskyella thalassocola TaxID=262004 RepID=A0A1G8MDK3_9FLAO|nr:hypothetical protein [Winogradskyella thalassocola]SDI66033.1 hypothetical protein SAMN04489796_1262 [Winogradskyella thalassocola]
MNIRNLFIIFLLFSIVSCISDNQKRKTDVDRLQLNGKVKSYLETIRRSSNELNDTIKTTFKEQHRELILFDKNGNIIEKVSFKKNGERYKKWISVYNDKGDEIEKLEIKYPNDTLKRWTAKYDNTGNKIESLIYDSKDSILSHTKSTYNELNKETELIILKSKKVKNQLVKVGYEYDKYDNEVKTTRIYADKSKTEWFTKYDSFGNETEWTVYDRMGNLERKDTTNYTYYNNNNIKEEKSYSSNDIPGVYGISKYGENGDEIEYVEYLNDSITSKEIYIYDNNSGQITKYYDSNGEIEKTIKLTSDFDSNGNLIKKSEYQNGKLRTIREYKIEYHK